MKTVFIVNPNAGSGKRFNSVIEKIKKLQVKLAINGLSKFRKQQIIKAT